MVLLPLAPVPFAEPDPLPEAEAGNQCGLSSRCISIHSAGLNSVLPSLPNSGSPLESSFTALPLASSEKIWRAANRASSTAPLWHSLVTERIWLSSTAPRYASARADCSTVRCRSSSKSAVCAARIRSVYLSITTAFLPSPNNFMSSSWSMASISAAARTGSNPPKAPNLVEASLSLPSNSSFLDLRPVTALATASETAASNAALSVATLALAAAAALAAAIGSSSRTWYTEETASEKRLSLGWCM